MLDFRMETFLTVCKTMNYTKAASQLNITQPGVSQHIRFLEQYYETPLFRYEGKKLSMTEAGELLRNAALTMVHDEKVLKNEMLQTKLQKERLIMGATLTVGEVIMPDVLKKYMREYPDTEIHMVVANTKELLTKLDEGEIDFALVEGVFKRKDYDFLHYTTERYAAICKTGYRFQKQVRRTEDLLEERLLLREPGSGTREILERYLESQNMSIQDFKRTAEISNLHTIKELVKSGCGITFLYETAVREELQRGELQKIKLPDFQITHDYTFIWRRGSIYAKTYKALFTKFS